MVYRTDHYGGLCEELAREAKINPEHCICREEALEREEESQFTQDNK